MKLESIIGFPAKYNDLKGGYFFNDWEGFYVKPLEMIFDYDERYFDYMVDVSDKLTGNYNEAYEFIIPIEACQSWTFRIVKKVNDGRTYLCGFDPYLVSILGAIMEKKKVLTGITAIHDLW